MFTIEFTIRKTKIELNTILEAQEINDNRKNIVFSYSEIFV